MHYIVVREYSKVTAKKQLWEPLTRPLVDKGTVDWQLEYAKAQEKKKRYRDRREVFVVIVLDNY